MRAPCRYIYLFSFCHCNFSEAGYLHKGGGDMKEESGGIGRDFHVSGRLAKEPRGIVGRAVSREEDGREEAVRIAQGKT